MEKISLGEKQQQILRTEITKGLREDKWKYGSRDDMVDSFVW